jgi:hypothetical protein
MPASLSRASTSRVDVGLRVLAANAIEELFEPGDAELRVHAALNHDLRRTLVDRVLNAFQHLVVRHRVAFLVLFGPEERTEGAVHVADVGVVDRRVDDVGDDLGRIHRHAPRVCGRSEIVQIGLGVEAYAFVEREPSAGGGAVE